MDMHKMTVQPTMTTCSIPAAPSSETRNRLILRRSFMFRSRGVAHPALSPGLLLTDKLSEELRSAHLCVDVIEDRRSGRAYRLNRGYADHDNEGQHDGVFNRCRAIVGNQKPLNAAQKFHVRPRFRERERVAPFMKRRSDFRRVSKKTQEQEGVLVLYEPRPRRGPDHCGSSDRINRRQARICGQANRLYEIPGADCEMMPKRNRAFVEMVEWAGKVCVTATCRS